MGEQVRVSSKKPEAKKENSISRIHKTDSSHSLSSPIDQILFLQRTIGNQAVQRLFKSGIIQAKLKIGQPGDIYEQEADRVADEVMRMPEPQVQRQIEPEEEEEETLQPKPLAEQITPLVQVQRQEEPEEEEETLQAKPLADQITPLVQRQEEIPEEEEEILQTKPVANQVTPLVQRQANEKEEEELLQTKEQSKRAPELGSNLTSQIQAMKDGGRPLSESTRGFFEPRFGRDFSNVRIHTDSKASEMAKAVNAQSFTTGSNIAFAQGKYEPETSSGKKLLGHELTHVVQQNGTKVLRKHKFGNVVSTVDVRSIIQRQGPVVVVPPPLKDLTIHGIVMDSMETLKGFPDNFLGALRNFETVVNQKSKEEAAPKDIGLIVIEQIGKFALDQAISYASSIVPGGKVATALTSLAKSIGTVIENEKKRVAAATESNILKTFIVSLNTHFTTLHTSINAAKGNDAAAARTKYKGLRFKEKKRIYRDELVYKNDKITRDLKTIYTVNALFQRISELWISKTKMPGEKKSALVRIHLNKDWKITDAYIDAPRGSRIAEQLLSGGKGKFDLSTFRVPRLIRWYPVPGKSQGLTRCWVYVSADQKFSGWGASKLGKPFLEKFMQLVTNEPIPLTVILKGHKTSD